MSKNAERCCLLRGVLARIGVSVMTTPQKIPSPRIQIWFWTLVFIPKQPIPGCQDDKTGALRGLSSEEFSPQRNFFDGKAIGGKLYLIAIVAVSLKLYISLNTVQTFCSSEDFLNTCIA